MTDATRHDRLTARHARRLDQLTDARLLLERPLDPVAFEIVFMRHVQAIRRYIGRQAQPATVDDLVSETFAIAFAQRGDYRPEFADARPWLYGIASNLVRNQRRRERARLQAWARVEPCRAPEGPEVVAVARAHARGMRPELAAAVATLHRGDRDALLLMAWADLSYQEIAGALGIPLGTVRSRINRARRRLRERLDGLVAGAAEA